MHVLYFTTYSEISLLPNPCKEEDIVILIVTEKEIEEAFSRENSHKSTVKKRKEKTRNKCRPLSNVSPQLRS